MAVQTDTIAKYFVRKYGEEEMEEFYKTLNETLLFYKFPLQICLSSNFQEGTLLGTLKFEELDRNGYPTYIGDVDTSRILYSTVLNFVNDRWIFTLSPEEGRIITIISSLTTSLNPTKVDYEGISRPTAGACRVGLAPR
jgi:hypothetical protein